MKVLLRDELWESSIRGGWGASDRSNNDETRLRRKVYGHCRTNGKVHYMKIGNLMTGKVK